MYLSDPSPLSVMSPKVIERDRASRHREAAERRARRREELQPPPIAGSVGDDERPVRRESNAVGRMMRPGLAADLDDLFAAVCAAGERVDRVGTPIEDEIRSGRRRVAGGDLFEDAGDVRGQAAGGRDALPPARRDASAEEAERERAARSSAQHVKRTTCGRGVSSGRCPGSL